MSNTKYRYNEKSLNFEPIVENKKDIVKRYLRYFYISLFSVIVLSFAFYPGILKVANTDLYYQNQKLISEYDHLLRVVEENQKELEIIRLKDDSIYSSIFGIKPLDSNIYNAGTGGSNKVEHLEGYSNSELMINASNKINKLSAVLNVHKDRIQRIESLSKVRSEKLHSIPAIQPIYNEDLIRTSSGFGYRIHPVYNVKKLHTGMDFVASEGTDVFATGDGVVKSVKRLRNGYGKHVIIEHKHGYESLYAHLSNFNVRVGQKVKRGDVIGYVGNTGTSTGVHLHYEVIKNGRKVNPSNYYFNDLSSNEYLKIVEMSNNITTSMD